MKMVNHTIYEIQKGLEVGSAFATLDTNRNEKVLVKPWTKPWAPGESTFSQDIWGVDRTKLLHQLNTKFTQAIIRGDAPNALIKDLAHTMDVSKKAASRLVMTESAFFASTSRLDGYKELDIERFEFVATLDNRTSHLCQGMDGRHPLLSEYEVGVTAPPLHPWCRSTTVPYLDDEFTVDETSTAWGENGKTYYVPADMKYKDWYKEHVAKTKESGIIKVEPTKIIDGHSTPPVKSNPNDIIDHVGKSGTVKTRSFYNPKGFKGKDINTDNHGNAKNHPYGKNGEHVHDYKWKDDKIV